MSSAAKRWLRWLAPLVLLIAAIVVFRDELPFLGQAWDEIRAADFAPLAAGFISAILSIAAMAAVMVILLNREHAITNIFSSTAITLASNAWSTSIPGGPAVSAWLTYRVHRSWGASTGLSGWFFVVSGAISNVWILLIGLSAVVFLGAQLHIGALAGTLALTVVVLGALYWATRNPAVLIRWARFLPARVRSKVVGVLEQVAQIRIGAGGFAAAAFCSLLNRLFDAATLYFAVWAVLSAAPGFSAGLNETTVMGVALAYVTTKLAGMAQVTPGGVGTVEAATAATLVASGMTLVDATAAALIYRLLSFAFITAVGWAVYLMAYAGKGYMLGTPRASADA